MVMSYTAIFTVGYGLKKDSSCSHMRCFILRNRFVFITNEVVKYIVHS